jgi:release factor glutamine methyltransferase
VEFDPAIRIADDPRVYRPSEDSRLLLESIRLEPGDRFLEVGTGTGLIALHAAKRGYAAATDANRDAAAVARANASRNGLTLHVVWTNLAAGVHGPFDVVAFNPPYLEGGARDELDRAWAGGVQGGEVAIGFLSDLPRILAPEGRAYLLLSRANAVARSLAESMFEGRLVSSKRLFFEDLDVLELRRRGP